MLKVRNIQTGYGKKQVLFDISIDVMESEVVAIIGPNGAGKSTILKAIFGLIPIWEGEINFNNINISNYTPAQNVSMGLTYLLQGNRVFDELTVMQNLEIGGFKFPKKERKKRIEEIFEIFPVLKDLKQRNAGKLSGGEQQITALARALITKPKFLILDEPSIGFSPNLVKSVFNKICQINCNEGISILIVEQKVREVLEICHRVYSIKLGRVIFSGSPSEIKDNKQKLKELFL